MFRLAGDEQKKAAAKARSLKHKLKIYGNPELLEEYRKKERERYRSDFIRKYLSGGLMPYYNNTHTFTILCYCYEMDFNMEISFRYIDTELKTFSDLLFFLDIRDENLKGK